MTLPRPLALACAAAFTSFLLIPTNLLAQRGPGVPEFWVRPGYRVTVAATDFPRQDVRFIEVDDRGTLYLSQPGQGRILALRDEDGDGTFEKRTDFVTGKETVHAMQFVTGDGANPGWLWFATSGAVFKTQDANNDGAADEVQTVVEGLPEGGGHWYRSLCVVGDGFFTSIGDSQNIGHEEAETTDRQKIWKFSLDGQNKTLWASGIRNTEKLRIRPGTDQLWGADHGSDNFGGPYGERSVSGDGLSNQAITDKMPPEEFNHYVQGGFYGHPWIVGDRVPRLEYRDRPDIATLAARTTPPAFKGGAHWANNGFCFTSKDTFGAVGDAFIAYHGSWNSVQRVGYQIHRVFFDDQTGLPYGGQTIVSTLSADGQRVLGRPCDVVEAPDGSLLWTDTQGRRIYRITKE